MEDDFNGREGALEKRKRQGSANEKPEQATSRTQWNRKNSGLTETGRNTK